MEDKLPKGETGESSKAAKLISAFQQLYRRLIPEEWINRQETVGLNIQKLTGLLLQGFLLFIVAEILFVFIFIFCKGFAGVYTNTQVGRQLLDSNPALAGYLFDFHKLQPMAMGLEVAVLALGTGLSAGVLFHFFQFSDNFFYSRGLFGKIIFFALPLAGVVTFISAAGFGVRWQIVFCAALVPALCFYSYCFMLPREILPTLGDLLSPSLRLSIAWETLRQAMVFFVLANGALAGMLLAADWLYEQCGPELPVFLRLLKPFSDFLNTLTLQSFWLFCLEFTGIIFLNGIILGCITQFLGLYPFLRDSKLTVRIFLTAAILAFCGYFFSSPFINSDSLLVVLVSVVVVAVFLGSGCFFTGHSLVVNISFLHTLEKRLQGTALLRRLDAGIKKMIKGSGWHRQEKCLTKNRR